MFKRRQSQLSTMARTFYSIQICIFCSLKEKGGGHFTLTRLETIQQKPYGKRVGLENCAKNGEKL